MQPYTICQSWDNMWTFTTVKVGFVCSWCPFPHNQNFCDVSCRASGVVTPNIKTVFFNKVLFITALTDISRDKMLASPMKLLGSFSIFNGDIFLSLFLIMIFTLFLYSSSLNPKCIQGYNLKGAGQLLTPFHLMDYVLSVDAQLCGECPLVWRLSFLWVKLNLQVVEKGKIVLYLVIAKILNFIFLTKKGVHLAPEVLHTQKALINVYFWIHSHQNIVFLNKKRCDTNP